MQVFDIVGGPSCVSASDGQRLHDKIAPPIKKGIPVVLSFERVDVLITAFLNAAVGQLYGELPKDRLGELLTFRDLDPDGDEMLKRVIENAERYFNNPEAFNRAWEDEVGDEDED